MAPTKIVFRREDWLINDLFEDSQLFLDEAKKWDGTDQYKARRYIRASIVTAFAALEAYRRSEAQMDANFKELAEERSADPEIQSRIARELWKLFYAFNRQK